MATTLNVFDKDGNVVTLSKPNGATIEAALATLTAQSSLASNAFGTITKGNAKSSAGAVRRIMVTNENAAARYFQLFAKASAPVAGTDTPLTGCSWKIPAGSATAPGKFTLEFDVAGLAVATGIAWAISTARSTFTDSATASEHDLALQFV